MDVSTGVAEQPTLTCQVCGRGPAELFTIKRHVGMIIFQKFHKLRAPLCREHALSISKEWLGKTLVQGWWGIISFFVNFFSVFTDLRAISQAKKMQPPV
jgi:hypothetical protein